MARPPPKSLAQVALGHSQPVVGCGVEVADARVPRRVHRRPGHVRGRGLEEPSDRRRAEAEFRDAEPSEADLPPIHEQVLSEQRGARAATFTPPGSTTHVKTSDVSDTARSWHAGSAPHKHLNHTSHTVYTLDCKT